MSTTGWIILIVVLSVVFGGGFRLEPAAPLGGSGVPAQRLCREWPILRRNPCPEAVCR